MTTQRYSLHINYALGFFRKFDFSWEHDFSLSHVSLGHDLVVLVQQFGLFKFLLPGHVEIIKWCLRFIQVCSFCASEHITRTI